MKTLLTHKEKDLLFEVDYDEDYKSWYNGEKEASALTDQEGMECYYVIKKRECCTCGEYAFVDSLGGIFESCPQKALNHYLENYNDE